MGLDATVPGGCEAVCLGRAGGSGGSEREKALGVMSVGTPAGQAPE